MVKFCNCRDNFFDCFSFFCVLSKVFVNFCVQKNGALGNRLSPHGLATALVIVIGDYNNRCNNGTFLLLNQETLVEEVLIQFFWLKNPDSGLSQPFAIKTRVVNKDGDECQWNVKRPYRCNFLDKVILS